MSLRPGPRLDLPEGQLERMKLRIKNYQPVEGDNSPTENTPLTNRKPVALILRCRCKRRHQVKMVLNIAVLVEPLAMSVRDAHLRVQPIDRHGRSARLQLDRIAYFEMHHESLPLDGIIPSV